MKNKKVRMLPQHPSLPQHSSVETGAAEETLVPLFFSALCNSCFLGFRHPGLGGPWLEQGEIDCGYLRSFASRKIMMALELTGC